MDYERTYFQEPIQCPECGLHTKELIRGASMDDERGKVTMCDACYDDGEGQKDWDDTWSE